MSFNPKKLYPADFVIRVFIYNTLIAIGLTVVSFIITKELIFSNFLINFIFSHFIGWSLALPLQWITKTKERMGPFQKSILIFFVFLIAGALGSMSAHVLIYDILFTHRQPWPPLTALFANLLMAFFFGLLAFFYFNLRHHLEKTINALKQKEIEKARLIQLQKSAELEALRAKIDPHFLFNTFNSIASLIRINPEQAELMLEKLSGLFRFSLNSSNRTFVELDEELNIVHNYLEIEKLRFGERLKYSITGPDHLKSALVPPLLIQPLVENSVKHGISKMKKDGQIDVEYKKVDNKLTLTIRDNGPGFDQSAINPGFGLQSVKERLTLLYNDQYSLEINNKNGVQITIRIPVNGKEKE